MKPSFSVLIISGTLLTAGCDGRWVSPTSQDSLTMGFFVSSAKSVTGNLGGLRGADTICQTLATAVGQGNKTWRAYLSVERDADNGNRPTDARSRIGNGPWVNALGVVVARDLNELHGRTGDAAVLVDERGQRIPGQWAGSPGPVEHDILTGSTADGTLMSGLRLATRTVWGPEAIRRERSHRGTRRTRIRTAPTRLPAAERVASYCFARY